MDTKFSGEEIVEDSSSMVLNVASSYVLDLEMQQSGLVHQYIIGQWPTNIWDLIKL